MSYRRKVDNNQAEIVTAARMVPGVSIFDASRVGHGLPDLIVGFRGKTYLFEVKSPKGKLTGAERAFFDNWHGHVSIIRSIDDLLQAIGAI